MARQYLINISDFNPGTTVKEIREANDDVAIRDQTVKLLERVIVHSGNAPGTPAYWKATYHEFLAANFAQLYLFTKISTCSLLAVWRNFMNTLFVSFCQNILQHCHLILTDDSMFNTAVQSYKNIVTNYQSSKMEIWNVHFLCPVCGVEGGNSSIEYAKSHGGQHNHKPSHSSSPALKEDSQLLKCISLEIHQAMKPVHACSMPKITLFGNNIIIWKSVCVC